MNVSELRKKEGEEEEKEDGVKMKIVRDWLAGFFLVHVYMFFMMRIAKFGRVFQIQSAYTIPSIP